jgi:hypothetical protein
MAKELTFTLSGTDYLATPVKLERKKIYGWSSLIATDKSGEECSSAYLSPDDAMVIPSGGFKQGTVDQEGKWVEKSSLVAYGPDEQPLPTYPSSFDAPIVLDKKVSVEQFLDNEWESVYQLVNEELAAAIGQDIYMFEFNFRASTNHNDGYLMNTPGGLFLFAGDAEQFEWVALADQTTIDETEEVVEEIDELDFSMF